MDRCNTLYQNTKRSGAHYGSEKSKYCAPKSSLKTYKNLYEQFISKENFELAYHNARKGKKKQRQVRKFKLNEDENLEAIRQEVINGEYHTSDYRVKTIYEPKQREIFILPFKDRIVQHAVMNILKPIFTNLLMENCYACIEGRGQMRAVIKCNEYVRRNKYCLKGDIRKFYPSINQRILSNMLHRIIKDYKFMRIIDDIIFSYKGGYNCPIGNFCSQWFGNFYLSVLDNYVLHELKITDYERYCDDFNIFSNSKEELKQAKDLIEKLLWNKLELKFSKAQIFNTKQGVDFCGYRSFGRYVLVRKKTARRIIRRFKHEVITDQRLASSLGWLKHACAHNLEVYLKDILEIRKEFVL